MDKNGNPAITANRLVHFIHIAKTGGHTMEGILERQYGPEALFYSRWGRQYEGPRGRPIGVFLKSKEPGVPGRIHYPELLEDVARRFKELPREARDRTRLIYGKNLEFGLADLLPDLLDYYTILRDPVDRVLSQYFFTVDPATRPSHVSLFEHIAAHVQPNMQTLMLSGPHGLNPPPEPAAMLAKAKENLEACTVVGLTEHFGETVLLLAKAFGWSEVWYARRKVNQDRPRMAEISRDVILRLAADNELDVELYRFGQTLFRKQLEAYGSDLRRDMDELGRRNLAYRSRSAAKHRSG
jgi:hypothetical protein